MFVFLGILSIFFGAVFRDFQAGIMIASMFFLLDILFDVKKIKRRNNN